MMPERKKAVTLIIEGMGGPSPMGGMDDDYGYAKKACAMKIMKCMEAKDVEGFSEYLAEFIDMCKDNPKPKMDMDY